MNLINSFSVEWFQFHHFRLKVANQMLNTPCNCFRSVIKYIFWLLFLFLANNNARNDRTVKKQNSKK